MQILEATLPGIPSTTLASPPPTVFGVPCSDPVLPRQGWPPASGPSPPLPLPLLYTAHLGCGADLHGHLSPHSVLSSDPDLVPGPGPAPRACSTADPASPGAISRASHTSAYVEQPLESPTTAAPARSCPRWLASLFTVPRMQTLGPS